MPMPMPMCVWIDTRMETDVDVDVPAWAVELISGAGWRRRCVSELVRRRRRPKPGLHHLGVLLRMLLRVLVMLMMRSTEHSASDITVIVGVAKHSLWCSLRRYPMCVRVCVSMWVRERLWMLAEWGVAVVRLLRL